VRAYAAAIARADAQRDREQLVLMRAGCALDGAMFKNIFDALDNQMSDR